MSNELATVDTTVEIQARTIQPRRAGAGLEKRSARDTRPMYAALGALLVEVAPGVYVESGRRPLLLDAENDTHTTVLTILVDKR